GPGGVGVGRVVRRRLRVARLGLLERVGGRLLAQRPVADQRLLVERVLDVEVEAVVVGVERVAGVVGVGRVVRVARVVRVGGRVVVRDGVALTEVDVVQVGVTAVLEVDVVVAHGAATGGHVGRVADHLVAVTDDDVPLERAVVGHDAGVDAGVQDAVDVVPDGDRAVAGRHTGHVPTAGDGPVAHGRDVLAVDVQVDLRPVTCD